jgi:hypothetical protein
MATKDLYQSLAQIAKQAVSITPIEEDPNKQIINKEINQIKKVTDLAAKMYPNNKDSQFGYFKKTVDISGMTPEAKNFYWNQYQKINPRGLEGTKQDYINITARELNQISGVSRKEFYLRNQLANAPEWVKPVLEPELAKLSTVVANANYSKATKVYEEDVKVRSNVFLANAQLDPDVSIEDHTADMVRLEQMNLLDIGAVVNGRVGVYKNGKEFVPSFAIKGRNEILSDDPYGAPSAEEQLRIKETTTPYFKQAVERKIYTNQSTINREEQMSAKMASRMLEDGKFTLDRWGEAFSMNPESNPQEEILRGLKGEISAKRVKTYQDLAQTIYTAMSKYGNMLGENNNG